MKQESTVSIVMCTYNGAKYIKEQIESIIHQSYPIHELIIQDDGSTDDTLRIVRAYAERYPFIHVYRNEGPRGVNSNFYSAMRKATGDFIAISDQDDIWEARKIEWQVESIGDAWLSAGITKPFVDGTDMRAEAYFDDRVPNICLERMMYSAMIAGHTMMIRREFLDKLFSLSDWIDRYMYDHFIQIVAGAYERISYIHKVLVHQRKHIGSATYTAPLDYSRGISNIYRAVLRTYRQYKQINPKMRVYFRQTYMLLNAIPADTPSKENGMRLARYQSGNALTDRVKLTILCVKLRNRMCYSKEKRSLFSLGRAIYFPIACSDYFRYMAQDTTTA